MPFYVVGSESGPARPHGIRCRDSPAGAGDLGLGCCPAGAGTASVRTLCRYAFGAHGLNRVGLQTLADNAAMRATAEKAGFRHEGTGRQALWVDGAFRDSVTFAVLRQEWRQP